MKYNNIMRFTFICTNGELEKFKYITPRQSGGY